MKKLSLILVSLFLSNILLSQTDKSIVTDIFNVTYSEKLEQPLTLSYYVQCPNGIKK